MRNWGKSADLQRAVEEAKVGRIEFLNAKLRHQMGKVLFALPGHSE